MQWFEAKSQIGDQYDLHSSDHQITLSFGGKNRYNSSMTDKPSRREVLAAGAAAMMSTPLLAATQNAPKSRPIVGSGAHTYEVYHDWVTPPRNLQWGDTHGVTTDADGNIYIAHTVHSGSVSSDAVVVYDQKGRLIRSFGSEFRGGAHGLDLRKEGSEEFLYHCDTSRRLVVKTDLMGKVIWQVGAPKEPGVYPDGNGFCPTNVAFAPDGDLFVSDGYGSSYVHRYTKDGEYVKLVCGPGSGEGQVSCPHGLWVDTRGREPLLCVADRSNNRLQNLTLDGKHVNFVKDGMRQPCHIHFNHGLMLVPDLASIVTILDKDNKVVAALGDGNPSNLRGAPRDQFIPGKFVHPHAAAWINKKDILVVEWVPIGRVTLLKNVA